MFADHYNRAYGYHGHHGRRHGHRRHHGGPGRVLPLLAVAFLAKAALRRAYDRPSGHRGRGPWSWGEERAPYGRWGDAPGRHGGWRHGHGHGHRRDGGPARGLRSEIGSLVMLLRDGYRRGALDRQKVDEIRTVLGDAQRRIAAILSGSGSGYTEV